MILTLSLLLMMGETKAPAMLESRELAPLSEPVSSFGAAVDSGWLYVYSGHTGGEHAHSKENLSPRFERLRLDDSSAQWESLPAGPPLQGVPLVGWEGKLYRVGGLSARNAKGEPEDLHSVASASVFDSAEKKWADLPALPQARSSHDACIVEGKLYVIGGWSLAGEEQTWCSSALVLDLGNPSEGWKEIATPPFQRRALAVVGTPERLYALGGMDSSNKTSAAVDIYDLKTGTWSSGTEIPTQGRMKAFGISAWAIGSDVFALGTDGVVLKQASNTNSWEPVGKLDAGRFFHRLLPFAAKEGSAEQPQQLLIVGGASMKTHQHLASVALVRVP